MVKLKVRENICIKTGIFMKATGKTTNRMGSVEALRVTGKNMKGSTKKERNTEMAP